MSSARGGGARGRGRGSTPPAASRARATSSRGRIYSSSAPRGSTTPRSVFTQPSRGNTNGATRATHSSDVGSANHQQTLRGASGLARTRGNWQERYQTLMKAREQERANAIRQGQIADPDKPRSLSEAVTPAGICQDMCAEYERVQRVVQKDVWDEELDSNHSAFASTEKEPDETRMVKKFRRAAAGLEEQLPSDLRPPDVLKRTCDYLFNEVVGNASSLARVHHFVWDRTRAIRNDFSIQQVTKPEELKLAIECYERIARFHVLSLHQLALPEKPYSKYDWQQEREQLDRTLLSLMQYYEDSRNRIELPNEAEFRSYCVIFQLQDPTPDLDDRIQTWPKRIVQDSRVQRAADLYMAACNVMDAQGPLKPRANHLIARQDWQRFWTLVSSREVSYLMACVAEIYFNLVRRMVLNALFRTFRMNSSLATPDWTVDTLCELLAFDYGDEVYAYCERFGFSFKEREDGLQYLDLTSVKGRTLPEPGAGMSKQTKSRIVEDKRVGRTLPAVINGLTVKEAQDAGLTKEEDDEGMMDASREGDFSHSGVDAHTEDVPVDDGESLFLPETITRSVEPSPHNPFTLKPSVADQKPFSSNNGVFTSSSFGKPSHSVNQASAFTANLDQGRTSIAAPVSESQDAVPTAAVPNVEMTPKPLFDYSSNFNSAGKEQIESKPDLFDFGNSLKETSASPFGNATSNPTGQSVLDQTPFKPSSNLYQAAASTGSPPTFLFSPPTKSTDRKEDQHKNDTIPTNLELPAIAVGSSLPSPEPAKSTFTTDQASEVAAAPNFNITVTQPQTKTSQPQFISPSSPTSSATTSSSHNTGSGNLGAPLKRTSFSTDTKPKKPSPLHNSIIATDESGQISLPRDNETVRNVQFEATRAHRQAEDSQKAAAAEFEALVTRIADDLCNDPDVGLLRQYIEYAVSKTIREVYDDFIIERNEREAIKQREANLCTKYFRKWRDRFWQRKHAKTGRERRERRQRRLEQRQSEQPEDSSVFTASRMRGSNLVGSFFGPQVGKMNENGGFEIQETVQGTGRTRSRLSERSQSMMTGNKRPASSHSDKTSAASTNIGHKRLKSTSHVDEEGRITKPHTTSNPHSDLLRRSAFLDFSGAAAGDGKNKDTTVSNYFRYKAMGLGKIDALTGVRGTKRRSESPQVSPQTSPPALRASSRLTRTPERSTTDRALMPPPSSSTSRMSKAEVEDEALFARLRAARESLKGSSSIFQSEGGKDNTLTKSFDSLSSGDSPSMIEARNRARLRSSQDANEPEVNGSGRRVPAYRLRESRFVPREHYGRAIERAREIRESRSRETSRPQSQLDEHSPGEISQSVPVKTNAQSRETQETEGVYTAQPLLSSIDNQSQADRFETAFTTHPTTKPFTTRVQAPVTFADHTTKMSSDNPFLPATVPETLAGLSSQPSFAFQAGHPSKNNFALHGEQHFKATPSPFSNVKDHTIQPSQVEQSLASSFGPSNPSDHTSFHPVPRYDPDLVQQDSYMHSEAISLMSDDEEDTQTPLQQPEIRNLGSEMREESEELLDNASDDDRDYMHETLRQHASTGGYQQSEEATSSQGWNSQADEQEYEGYPYNSRNAEDSEVEGSDENINGYAGDEFEDEQGVDADVEDETDEERYEDDEDEETDDDWEHQEYANQWIAAPPKSSALQEVGATVEEAIELSD